MLIATAAMIAARKDATVSAQTIDPSTLPRLSFGDLSYVGGFRLPSETVNGDSFSAGGRQMTFNPDSNSLFVGTRAGRIAEVSIPSPVNTANVEAMPFARMLQGFVDPTEGHMSQIAADGITLDGLLVHNHRLYGTASIFYDANNTQRVSHYSRSLQLNTPSFSGWSAVWDSARTGFVSGMMAMIPAEWRNTLGGPAATAQCCIPIVSRTSWGPSAFSFDPAQVGQSLVPASALLYYTGDHPTLGLFDASNPTYGATIQMGGFAIIGGTRTALYFGRNGTGPNCYGNGTSDQSLAGTIGPDGAHWCYDPTNSDKGQHAYPYRYQIWAYDLNDFAAVKSGAKQPWEIVPYGVWPFEFPTPEIAVRIGGVGYDAATQTLYVSQLYADRDGYSYRPVIHVLHVNGTNGVSTVDSGTTPLPTTTTTTTTTTSPTTTTTTTTTAPAASTLVKSITLAVNRTAPQAPGTPITFTAFATGGVAPQEYKWLVDDGSGFKPVTAWSAIDTFTWTPAVANLKYRVGVWARSAGSTKDEGEATASTEFSIAAPVYRAVQSVTFTANKTAPQPLGTTVTFTAAAVGGNGPIQYKWLVHDGGSWSAVTGWSTQSTFAWTPAVANGNYRIGVWARSDGKTTDDPDATNSGDFAISAPATTVTVTPTPTTTVYTRVTEVVISTDVISPQPVGRTITATATPSGGANHTYRWLIHDGSQWNIVSDWTTSNRFAWKPTKADPNYRIGVWVRNGNNTTENYDVSASLLFSIQ